MPKLCPMTPTEIKGHKTHSFQIIPQDPGPQSTKPFVLSRTAIKGNSSVCEKSLERALQTETHGTTLIPPRREHTWREQLGPAWNVLAIETQFLLKILLT